MNLLFDYTFANSNFDVSLAITTWPIGPK